MINNQGKYTIIYKHYYSIDAISSSNSSVKSLAQSLRS
jgi:hypothetical protein